MIKQLTLFVGLAACTASYVFAQVPTPKAHFGFNIGDDYHLANYSQTEAYFKKVASGSDRVKLVDIGKTEEGRSQYMVIVSSPENIKNLDKYKEIGQRLARAENLNDAQAMELAKQGKAIIWIDGGLHATETVGAHQLIETIYQVATRNDEETKSILKDAIILFVHANPDGQELVSNWYMRESKPEKRALSQLPRLYQKYIGHDNNRDFFMNNMKETQNMSHQQYIEWMPQIIYNHHQTGPAGTVVAGPPYRDPFNYVFDPLLVTSLDAVGAAMINRLNVEGKPGYTQRAGSVYSTWWNGGLRTTGYFHNMVGLLTEIIGNPTPTSIPLVPERLIPNAATPFPVKPQPWHFRQSIDYSVSLNYAVLDYAVRQREHLLYNIYKMGKRSIEAGNTDYWTLSPRHVDSINSAYQKDRQASEGRRGAMPIQYFNKVFKDSTLRDPRGYIIPADQADFPTAVKFINALIHSGIQVHKSTGAFAVAGKQYPEGSYIVKTSQAFRPHVLDMFEPQDHPNDFQYPGGPPVRPYDAAGWTLAYEMGVVFDRILDPFSGPFQAVPYGELQSPRGAIVGSKQGAGFIIDSRANNSFIAVNDLLQSGAEVYRINNGGKQQGSGSFFVPAKSRKMLDEAASKWGLMIEGVAKRPTSLQKLQPQRIALWDTYGGSMPSGWTRWLLEQYHFPFDLVYANDINRGNLKSKYDVIVFVSGAIPSATPGRNFGGRTPDTSNIPTEYHHTLGRLTADTSIYQLKKFMEAGGEVVTIGSSTSLAYHLGLPVRNALVEMNEGTEKSLPGEKFYIPGSILRVAVDSTQPAAFGMPSKTDVYFEASPVFRISPNAIASGAVKPLVWFDTAKPLRSGWAWGQSYLQDGVAAFEAPIGKGALYAFGPEITFRAQTHGTFKLLFNQLYSHK